MATARQLDSVISRREIFEDDGEEGDALLRSSDVVGVVGAGSWWVSLELVLSAIACVV